MPDPSPVEWSDRLSTVGPGRGEYTAALAGLAALYGPGRSAEFVALAFAKVLEYEAGSFGKDKKLKVIYKVTTTDRWQHAVTVALETERRLFLGRLSLFERMHREAIAGRLSVKGGRKRDRDDFYTPTPGLDGRAAQVDAAAQWAVAHDRQELPRIRFILDNNVLLGPSPATSAGALEEGLEVTTATFGSWDVLVGLHGHVYKGDKVDRVTFQAAGAAYTSTVGGRCLIERLYSDTTIPQQSMSKTDYWTNWAMFFAGMVGAAQGFADANKRVTRMLYAAIVLRGDIAFVAPTKDYSNRLLAMN